MNTKYLEKIWALGLIGLGILCMAWPFLPRLSKPCQQATTWQPRFYLGPQIIAQVSHKRKPGEPRICTYYASADAQAAHESAIRSVLDIHVYVHNETLKLRATIYDDSGHFLYGGPVRSRKMLVASKAPVVAILGKHPRSEEYVASVNPFDYEDFSIFTPQKGMQAVKGTGIIQAAAINSDGTLVISGTRGLQVYSCHGRLLWHKPFTAIELKLWDGGVLQTKHLNKQGQQVLSFWNCHNGQAYGQVVYPQQQKPHVLLVSDNGKRALISQQVGRRKWEARFQDLSKAAPATSSTRFIFNGSVRQAFLLPNGTIFFLLLVPTATGQWYYTGALYTSDGQCQRTKQLHKVDRESLVRIKLFKENKQIVVLIGRAHCAMTY